MQMVISEDVWTNAIAIVIVITFNVIVIDFYCDFVYL